MAFENLKNLWQVVEQAIGRLISSQTGREKLCGVWQNFSKSIGSLLWINMIRGSISIGSLLSTRDWQNDWQPNDVQRMFSR